MNLAETDYESLSQVGQKFSVVHGPDARSKVEGKTTPRSRLQAGARVPAEAYTQRGASPRQAECSPA